MRDCPIEGERLRTEIRRSISYMQPDKETIQSLSRGLEKRKRCLRAVWKEQGFGETMAWSAAWFWLFGCWFSSWKERTWFGSPRPGRRDS